MRKELDGGLILRSLSQGIASDRENLKAFYVDTFSEAGEDDADALGLWADDLISDKHPTVTDDDIWVLVDPAEDQKIVSALLLIPQTWRYEDIEVGVGRVELVATDKAYRKRGLVRALMNAAHERSESLGHLMQGITGIRHYYRRFGYSMSIDLGIRAVLPFSAIPKLPEDNIPKYALRSATEADVSNLAVWDQYRARTAEVSCTRDEVLWRYELNDRSKGAPFELDVQIIVDAEGEGVGYVSLRASDEQQFFACYSYVVGEKSSYLATFMDVLYGMKKYADARYKDNESNRPPYIYFDTGMEESLDILVGKTFPALVRPDRWVYAWYIRVADLARFIKHIAPVLERRLVGSGAHRFTGELKVYFFDHTGLTITFGDGRITDAVVGEMEEEGTDAGFPYLTFLDVVFGRRAETEIDHILPEAFASRKGLLLLNILFPKKRSWVLALG